MPYGIDPMHAARLAAVEGALCALLREAASDPSTVTPDGISVHLTPDGLDVAYWRGEQQISGEGL